MEKERKVKIVISVVVLIIIIFAVIFTIIKSGKTIEENNGIINEKINGVKNDTKMEEPDTSVETERE